MPQAPEMPASCCHHFPTNERDRHNRKQDDFQCDGNDALAAPKLPMAVERSNVPGATNATLLLVKCTACSMPGNYSVLVSNPGGAVASSNALLTVNPAICIPAPSGLIHWWPAEGTDH